jgi:MFS transporter, ACS family, solute carrier family 17 (sodium-dependent inorganic phosphate cotransporter), member 6/7/8
LPLSAWLVSYVHWSTPFYIYGIAGVLWTCFWFRLAPMVHSSSKDLPEGFSSLFSISSYYSMTFEKPAFHPTISAEEKQFIEQSIGQVSQTHPTVGFDFPSPRKTKPSILLLGGTHFNLFYLQLFTIPWRAILSSKPVWAIIVANFARSWSFYLLLQNQLTYMRDVLGLRINDVLLANTIVAFPANFLTFRVVLSPLFPTLSW